MLDVIWDKSNRVVYQTFCKITHVVSSISFGTNLIGKSVPNFLQHIHSSYHLNLRSRPAFGRPRKITLVILNIIWDKSDRE